MLIAAIIALLVIIGVYFLVVNWDVENDTTKTDTVYENTNYLIDVDDGNISYIEFNNGTENYKIFNGDKLTIKGYSSNIIDESKLSSAIYSASKIASSRTVIENAKNLSEYGLENPLCYVKVVMNDSSVTMLQIGNPTNIDGEYYVKLENLNDVYTISSYTAEKLLASPSEYRSMELCSMDGQSMEAFTIEKGGKAVLSVAYDKDYEAVSEHIPVSYIVSYPFKNVKASLDKINEFVSAITSPTATAIIEENPSNLKKYGLDNAYTLSFKDANGNSTVKMGSYAENGEVYIMYNDIPVVYTAECPFYEAVKNANPKEFVDRFINLFTIEEVENINILADNEEYELSIIKKGEDKYEYKINGKIKAEDSFKKIYQNIIGIVASDFTNEKPSGKEKCKITFNFTDGKAKTFTYYEYDERRCIVKADNGLICLTMAKEIDAMLSSLK